MKNASLWFIVIFTLLRLFYLPIEHTGDGWGYACEILKSDYFSPHHILYKPFLGFCYHLTQSFGLKIDPIQIFTSINVLIGGLCLYVFSLILNQFNVYSLHNFYLLILVASTLSFLRYSSENETYILPLFFSLLGSYYYIKNQHLWAFTLLSIAVLFHQIHVFWLLSFVICHVLKTHSYKSLLFTVGSILFVYVIYANLYHIKWYLLPFHDVNQGLVDTTISAKNFIMTPISLVRTFIQVHGNMKYILLEAPGHFAKNIFFTIICIEILAINFKELLREMKKAIISTIRVKTHITNPFYLALLLHLLFAFYSVGNAEFMVMLPFLIVLWQYKNIEKVSLKFIQHLCAVFFIWNSVFYIIPSKTTDFHCLNNKLKEINKTVTSIAINDSQIAIVSQDNILFSNYLEYLNLTKQSKSHFQIIPYSNHAINISADFLKKNPLTQWVICDEPNNNIGLNRMNLINSKIENTDYLKLKFRKKLNYNLTLFHI